MSKTLFYQCLVLDVNDPLMLGRIRGTLIIDNYADIIRSFDDPPWDEAKDAWTERDPFIFNPLLPYFIYQVPKPKELVQIMYLNNDFKYQNQYYVQNTFYSPTSSFFQFNEGGNKFTGTGMQIKGPKPLKEKTSGTLTEKGVHKGVFPEPGDNAILGRGSADLIVKENEVLLRAGKFQGESLQPNIVPVANQQRGYLQLTRFPSVKIPLEPKKYMEIEEKVLLVKYLMEWTIINPENAEDKFAGTVYLYQLKPDISINTQNLTLGTPVNENLKVLVATEEFFGLSTVETVNFINLFIQACNNKFVTKSGTQLFSSQTTDRFPIFYRPNNLTYSYINPSSNRNTTSQEFINISNIFSKVKLNPPIKQGGYGLIYKLDTVGTPMETKTVVVPQSKYFPTPQTFGALGADKVFLLSNQTAIPGKRKINFDDTLYGISNDKFSDDIIPNTSSMVRGEELLELINLITRFLLTHTHAYPGLPPVPVTQDGTTATDILTELQNAVTKVLNENIRLN